MSDAVTIFYLILTYLLIFVMFALPLAAIVWFVFNLVVYIKTPKRYRPSKRTPLIVSAVLSVVLGYFLTVLFPLVF